MKSSGAFLWQESTANDAIYTTWQGSQYLCPRNTRLRMVEGILAFTKTNPGLPLLSEAERLGFVAELAVLRQASAHARSYILSSAWHVPLRWFSAFTQPEREIYDLDGHSSIRYRTSVGEAIDRVHWAGSVTAAAGFAEPVVARLQNLEDWLVGHEPECMIELDYGQTALEFSEGTLAFDESADDIRQSLLALEASDYETSGEAYQRVAMRWADAQAYTFSN